MTTGMRQHRAMVLISNIHRRQFRAILVGFKELLLSEIERGRAAKQGGVHDPLPRRADNT